MRSQEVFVLAKGIGKAEAVGRIKPFHASWLERQARVETRKALQVQLQAYAFYDGQIDGDFGGFPRRVSDTPLA